MINIILIEKKTTWTINPILLYYFNNHFSTKFFPNLFPANNFIVFF
jgi:hypothetical protein